MKLAHTEPLVHYSGNSSRMKPYPMTTPDITYASNRRYQLLEELGTGGMGTVYRTRDLLTGQLVAMKRLRHAAVDLTFMSRSEQVDPSVALAREFSTLATLRHPNIIEVLDFGFDEGVPFYTMALLEEASDLREEAERRDLNGKVALLADVLQALRYLHRRGIVHRDLKPANVLVDAKGRARVLDFGLAQRGGTSSGIVGTLNYMAPEMFTREEATFSSDLYAVGVMAFEMLAGEHPFESDNLSDIVRRTVREAPDVDKLPVDDHFKMFIAWMLAKDPQDRYPSAQAALYALADATDFQLPAETRATRASFLQAAEFVGRDDEMRTLLRALDDAKGGRGAGWLVAGESGVGKTRLLRELRTRALVKGFQVLEGSTIEEPAPAFQLFRGVLPPLLLTTPIEPAQAAILRPLMPELPRLTGYDEAVLAERSFETDTQLVADTIADLILAQTQPTLVLLEDVHIAEESLLVLRRLVDESAQHPLLIVASYRKDEAPYFYGKVSSYVKVLDLKPLQHDEIADLTRSMLGEVGAREEVVRFVERESEGNTFFMIDLIQTLADMVGSLDEIGKITLPDSLVSRGVIEVTQARVERLPLDYHPLLRLAAVIGREIDLDLLTYVDDEFDIFDWLNACSEVSLLTIRDGKWQFAYDKIRDGLLLSIDERVLPQLHELAAEAIEAVYADHLAEHYARLLYHWQQTGNEDRVIDYTLRHTRQQLPRSTEYGDFRARLETLLTRIDNFDARRVEAERLLATIYNRLGEAKQAIVRASTGLLLANEHNEISEIILLHEQYGFAARQLAQNAIAREQYEIGLRKALDADQILAAASLHTELGWLAVDERSYDAAHDHFEQALQLALSVDNLRLEAVAHHGLGSVAQERGASAQALEWLTRALAGLSETGDRFEMARVQLEIGRLHYQLGDDEFAGVYFDEAMSAFQTLHVIDWEARVLVARGHMLRRRYYLQEALEQYDEAGQIFSTRGITLDLIEALACLAYTVAFQYQDAQRAARRLQGALEQLHNIRDEGLALLIVAAMARIDAQNDQPLRAARLLGVIAAHRQPSYEANEMLWQTIPVLEFQLEGPELAQALAAWVERPLNDVLAEIKQILAGLVAGSEAG